MNDKLTVIIGCKGCGDKFTNGLIDVSQEVPFRKTCKFYDDFLPLNKYRSGTTKQKYLGPH